MAAMTSYENDLLKGGPNSTQELINKEIAQSTLRNSWWKQKFSWNHKEMLQFCLTSRFLSTEAVTFFG